MKTIAVAFDGVITKYSKYPETGQVRSQIKPFLSNLLDNGYRLVLYTNRKGSCYQEALATLKREGLYDLFDWKYMKQPTEFDWNGNAAIDLYVGSGDLLIDFDEVDWGSLLQRIKKLI